MVPLGCIRAKIGSTTYYICKMTAGELIDKVGIAKEPTECSNMTLEEKIQPKCDIKRIVEEIVPYVTEDPDRFFSGLIVDIYSGFDEIRFEPLSKVANNISDAYAIPMADMGFITLPDKGQLIALDGQHRLLSLKIAIQGIMGVPDSAKTLVSMDKLRPHPELVNEELSIILVKHTDSGKIQKSFYHFNKYTKHTSRRGNIISSDDDPFAVISRRLYKQGGPLAPIQGIDLVNWKSNVLSQRSKNLTTLSTLYTVAETILKDRGFSTKMLPDTAALDEAYKTVAPFWSITLKGVRAYQQYLELTRNNRPVSNLREENLLLKPATQMALAHVALLAQRKEISWRTVVGKLNRVDWSCNNELWFNILVIGNTNKKMITGKDAIRSAGMVIAYMVMGSQMSQEEIEDVRQIIRNARNDESAPLPQMIP